VTFRVLPLDFREFLRFRSIAVPAKPRLVGTPPEMENALRTYLRWGGFPASLLSGHPEAILYVCLTFGAFALARLKAAPAHRLAIVRGWFLAGILSLALAAPILLPASSYLPQTTRYKSMVARNNVLARKSFRNLDWQEN